MASWTARLFSQLTVGSLLLDHRTVSGTACQIKSEMGGAPVSVAKADSSPELARRMRLTLRKPFESKAAITDQTEACKKHKKVMVSHLLRGVLRESSEL